MSSRRLIITVHGIRTYGGWQENLEHLSNAEFGEGEIKFLNYKYGYFSIIGFLIPFARWLVVRQFRKELLDWCRREEWERIDIFAHSFGTHIVAWAVHGIERKERPFINTIVLAGSVLKPSFPWSELSRNVRRIVNDCGALDNILIINQLFVLFTGAAGRTGFAGATHSHFRNRFFVFGHSGYFSPPEVGQQSWMQKYWLPLLKSEEAVKPLDLRNPPTVIDGVVNALVNNSEPIKLFACIMPILMAFFWVYGLYLEASQQLHNALGHVDKRDSHGGSVVIQAGICDGDQLGTKPDVGRGMGVL